MLSIPHSRGIQSLRPKSTLDLNYSLVGSPFSSSRKKHVNSFPFLKEEHRQSEPAIQQNQAEEAHGETMTSLRRFSKRRQQQKKNTFSRHCIGCKSSGGVGRSKRQAMENKINQSGKIVTIFVDVAAIIRCDASLSFISFLVASLALGCANGSTRCTVSPESYPSRSSETQQLHSCSPFPPLCSTPAFPAFSRLRVFYLMNSGIERVMMSYLRLHR